MKKFIGIFFLLLTFFLAGKFVFASSGQAYTDYQYQFGLYRQSLTNFQDAITQYRQFNSLTSQQDALDKAKQLIAQRDMAAKSYFLFLNEKLNENPGITTSEAAGYRSTMTNQIAFLDQNSLASGNLQSLSDAQSLSDGFIKNYLVMQSSYRQTIVAIELGYLNYFASAFDSAAAQAQTLIGQVHDAASPEKQATLDRWLVNLANQHSLYQQKAMAIKASSLKITGDLSTQDRQFSDAQKLLNDAQDILSVGSSYLTEVETAIQYE